MKFRYYVIQLSGGSFFGTNDLEKVYSFVDEFDDDWRAVDAKTGEEIWDVERDKEGRAEVSVLGYTGTEPKAKHEPFRRTRPFSRYTDNLIAMRGER